MEKEIARLKKPLKIAVGLSGGVDSSVAALLLKQEGHDVTAVHMRCWDYDLPGCKGASDRADAIKVASLLDVPFIDLNFEKEYEVRVLNYFFDEIKAGRTPNPDVMCNKEIKFGLFLDWAISNGFDQIATGHYARIDKNPKLGANANPKEEVGQYLELLSGIDASKDQSYFLYRLKQKQLGYILFPIGHLKKSETRELAKSNGLPVYNKPDSTGICFIGDLDVNDFIKSRIKVKRGRVLDMHGQVVGEHAGSELYTIGQRHGFKLSKYIGMPVYVVRKDVKANTITIGFGQDSQNSSFEVGDLSWINDNEQELSSVSLKCQVRIRNLGDKTPCLLLGSNIKLATKNKRDIKKSAKRISSKYKISTSRYLNQATSILVKLDDFAIGVAPGQSAVFYQGDKVLGGGTIL